MNYKGKVLITGASGFIGGRIVEVAHLTGKVAVRAGIRTWSNCARIGRFPLEIVHLDLLDPESVNRAIDGVSAVIHCAMGNRRTAVEGTTNLVTAAFERKINRFIHLSSATVYGDREGTVGEEEPLCSMGNEYADAKIEAEKAVWSAIDKGFPAVIFRPSIVYGPFCPRWSLRPASMILRGSWKSFGSNGEGICNVVYVDDLVKVLLYSLVCDSARGQAFNITDGSRYTWNFYFENIAQSLGIPFSPSSSSRAIALRSVAMMPVRKIGGYLRDHHMALLQSVARHVSPADKLMRSVEQALISTVGTDELKLFSRNVIYDISKARKFLGYTPTISLEQGLFLTKEWLEQQWFLRGRDTL